MENNAAAKMIEDMQERFPGLTPEVAAQTILVESLKACQSIMDLTRLPVDPRVLSQLRDGGLIDQAEWERIMAMLDPQSGVPSIDASGE
jgi:hypothetical protein|tara:strand:+ start:873 stop:1139 length:267 start_codon:yes stop_codon:yes gene_type:complete